MILDSLTITHSNGRVSRITEKAPTNLLTGTFEIVQNGRHSYYYDNAGSLTRDVLRNITIHNDINGNPDFITFGGGSEIESGYTTGGQKLWTVHRTAAGFIPSDVLSDPNKPKPTPEIGNTPSQYSRLSDYLIQNVGVTRYYDGYEFYDRNLTEGKFYFSNGYVSFHSDGSFDYSAIITDYRGSTRVVMTMDSTLSTSNIVQANSYYPSGALVTDVQTSFQLGSTSGGVQTHKFLGKELDRMYGLDWYDLGARRYDAAAETFWAMDPLCEQYYHINPYAYCAGDPINYIDPNGCDTLNITRNQEKWLFGTPITAKGDDVFNVSVDNKTYSYKFSEGNWGERVNALNLEITDNYALGVYHVSGVEKDGTGYYVTPGGEASRETNSGKRIPEGIYPIIAPVPDAMWQQPGIGGLVAERGCRFHYGGSKPRDWTVGCFILSFDYSIKGNIIYYDLEQSKKAVQAFDYLLGGSEFYSYTVKTRSGVRTRYGSYFENGIDKKLILKSR